MKQKQKKKQKQKPKNKKKKDLFNTSELDQIGKDFQDMSGVKYDKKEKLNF